MEAKRATGQQRVPRQILMQIESAMREGSVSSWENSSNTHFLSRRLSDLTLIELTVFICSQPDILIQSSRGYRIVGILDRGKK
jgi:hypothetical protein